VLGLWAAEDELSEVFSGLVQVDCEQMGKRKREKAILNALPGVQDEKPSALLIATSQHNHLLGED